MSKLRKLITFVLAACTVVCAGLALAACDKSSKYPDYKNPETSIGGSTSDDNSSSGYTINVRSAGGLSLNSVKVTAKKNGVKVMEGISINGKIQFDLAADEYDLEIDSTTLPAGYYLPEGTSYSTTTTEKSVTISIPSRVISSTASSSKRYSLGDVMYDFGFTDTTGKKHTLTEFFEEPYNRKAVVLNFWYIACSPCKSEFPAINSAYEKYKDSIDIIALSDQDTFSQIVDYHDNQFDYKLGFYMGQDQSSLADMFSVSAYPTTVIIDRYGVIAYLDSGAVTEQSKWESMFAKYTSDSYVQATTSTGSSDDENVEMTLPTVSNPELSEVSTALNGTVVSTANIEYKWYYGDDKAYAWPFVVESSSDRSYITASNKGVDNSFASLYVTFTLNPGDIFSFDYNIYTEEDADYVYVILQNADDESSYIKQNTYSGNCGGWKTESAYYVATRKINLIFSMTYVKDTGDATILPENEKVYFDNLTIISASSITNTYYDVATSAVDGNITATGYEEYAQVIAPTGVGDDIYYKVKVNGVESILFADILSATAWSSRVIGGDYFTDSNGTNREASLYNISYWDMSNYTSVDMDNEIYLTFDFENFKSGNKQYANSTFNLINTYYLQGFSDNGYVPVTEDVKDFLEAFSIYYCTINNINIVSNQWEEFCYYIKHYGIAHAAGTSCAKDVDPTAGLSTFNAFTAYESTTDNTVLNSVAITKGITRNRGGGLFYKFVPTSSGVYKFTSLNSGTDDPLIILLDGQDTNITAYEKSYGSTYAVIAEIDDDFSVEALNGGAYSQFVAYAYLTAGNTYYVQARVHTTGDTGSYDFKIEKVADETYSYMRVASTEYGWWSYRLDETTGEYFYYYLAVDVAISNGIWYQQLSNGDLGSKIYIDFVHANYFDSNNHSLKDMIDNGEFDLRSYGGGNYTSTMRSYYQSAISVSETDELYGLAEANSDLVSILINYLYLKYEGDQYGNDYYWLSLAAYRETISANN